MMSFMWYSSSSSSCSSRVEVQGGGWLKGEEYPLRLFINVCVLKRRNFEQIDLDDTYMFL